MEIVRNFINVLGLTPISELPDRINGQVIQHGDVETIYITEENFSAKCIFQIILQAKITSTRRIEAPLGTTLIIDGYKELKILYSEDGDSSKARITTIRLPYNTFAELPSRETVVEKINLYLLDGYFELLDSRRIYSFITYLVDIHYGSKRSIEEEQLTKVYYNTEDNTSEEAEQSISLERYYRNGEEIFPKYSTPAESDKNKMEMENTKSENFIDIDSEYL